MDCIHAVHACHRVGLFRVHNTTFNVESSVVVSNVQVDGFRGLLHVDEDCEMFRDMKRVSNARHLPTLVSCTQTRKQDTAMGCLQQRLSTCPLSMDAVAHGRVLAEMRLAGEIAAFTTSMRLVGVGTPGGVEALAIFHLLLYDERMTGSLRGPLARVKVDEKNCFARGGVAVHPQSTRQPQRGNMGARPVLNRMGSCQCRRIEVQSKETLTAPWSAA